MDKDNKKQEDRLEPSKYEESIAYEIKKQILDELDIKLDDLIEEAITKREGQVNEKIVYENVHSHNISRGNEVVKQIGFDPSSKYVVKNKLKEFIKRSPYSQTEIANMTGITVQTLSNIVNNKYNTSLEVALKLSYILDVTFDILFYLEKEK